jgi:hypothetical protein
MLNRYFFICFWFIFHSSLVFALETNVKSSELESFLKENKVIKSCNANETKEMLDGGFLSGYLNSAVYVGEQRVMDYGTGVYSGLIRYQIKGMKAQWEHAQSGFDDIEGSFEISYSGNKYTKDMHKLNATLNIGDVKATLIDISDQGMTFEYGGQKFRLISAKHDCVKDKDTIITDKRRPKTSRVKIDTSRRFLKKEVINELQKKPKTDTNNPSSVRNR